MNIEHIWYIFKTLVDIFHYLYLSRFPLGDISPDNLIVDTEGEIKFLNTCILKGYKSGLERGLANLGYECCYSPEELSNLNVNKRGEKIDLEKSIIFSMGVIILAVACRADY